jgi:DNA-binding NarL/FixJ family response regulator
MTVANRQQDKSIVGLVDDHPIVRQGLAQLINAQPDFSVGLEASSAPEAITQLSVHPVDLLLVDLSLREGSGIDLVREANTRWPDLAILVLSMHEEQLYAERVLRVGARGYIM